MQGVYWMVGIGFAVAGVIFPLFIQYIKEQDVRRLFKKFDYIELKINSFNKDIKRLEKSNIGTTPILILAATLQEEKKYPLAFKCYQAVYSLSKTAKDDYNLKIAIEGMHDTLSGITLEKEHLVIEKELFESEFVKDFNLEKDMIEKLREIRQKIEKLDNG